MLLAATSAKAFGRSPTPVIGVIPQKRMCWCSPGRAEHERAGRPRRWAPLLNRLYAVPSERNGLSWSRRAYLVARIGYDPVEKIRVGSDRGIHVLA